MGFIAPNTLSLAQAYAEAWWQPYAVFVGDTMVGFVMYGRWPETGIPATHEGARPGVDYLLRLMIDGRYQGKGYGRAAMERVIAQVRAQPGFQALELSYDAANTIAHNLYTSLGFQPTGRIVGGEIEAQVAR
jgi:diamine N-acetyltransferase